MGYDYPTFLDSILEQSHKTITELRSAIEKNNIKDAIRLIAILKNTADTIGLHNLSSFCETLSNNVDVHDKHTSFSYISKIDSVIENTIKNTVKSEKLKAHKGRMH